MRSRQQKERSEDHQQGTQTVGGHHHAPFWPAVNPNTRDGAQHHGGDRVGHVHAGGQQGDALCSGFEVHADRRGDLRQGAVVLRCAGHPVLGDQVHHQHDVELVCELREDLSDPEATEAVEAHDGLKSAGTFRIATGGQGGFLAVDGGSAHAA